VSLFFLIIFRVFSYGLNGMLAGSATVFFAYIGFYSVASTAEEVSPILLTDLTSLIAALLPFN
jgi:amino acid transporter